MKKTVLWVIVLAVLTLVVSFLVKVNVIPFSWVVAKPHVIMGYGMFLLVLAIALGIYDQMGKKQ